MVWVFLSGCFDDFLCLCSVVPLHVRVREERRTACLKFWNAGSPSESACTQHGLPLSMTGWSLEWIGSNPSSFRSSLWPPSSCLRCGTAPNREQQEWELESVRARAVAPRTPVGMGCSGALSLPLPSTSQGSGSSLLHRSSRSIWQAAQTHRETRTSGRQTLADIVEAGGRL